MNDKHDDTMTVDLGRACARCGARHRTWTAEARCWYPNASDIDEMDVGGPWVLADIHYAYMRSRSSSPVVAVFLFPTKEAAEVFPDGLAPFCRESYNRHREFRVLRIGGFIPGASRWDDAPSRRKGVRRGRS